MYVNHLACCVKHGWNHWLFDHSAKVAGQAFYCKCCILPGKALLLTKSINRRASFYLRNGRNGLVVVTFRRCKSRHFLAPLFRYK